MIFVETLRMAMGSLLAHKTRSLLTILGVIIGIGSVLAVVVLGSSFEAQIVGQFDSVDQKSIYVYSSVTPIGQGPPDCQTFCNIFTDVDRARLEDLGGVERVTVSVDVAATSMTWKGKPLTYERLTATVPESDDVRSAELYASGGPFKLGQNEVVVGSTIAQLLAGGENATPQPKAGDAITIRFPDGREVQAKIAGVLLEDETLFGDRNGRVFVPVDPFYTTTRPSPSTGQEVRVYAGFTVIAKDIGAVSSVQDAADAYIQEDSDAARLKVEDQSLAVDTASDIQGQISQTFGQVTTFIGAIGGVSLVVGAIGIANIMLVSVTERTREIGVMKAIGAKNGEILRLFLMEAVLIGVVGSILAIALGLGLGSLLVAGVFETAVVVPYDWLVYAILIGVGVGVVSGLLPARRATRIETIKALSYE